MMSEREQIHVGATVVRADGLQGTITDVDGGYISVLYENGKTETVKLYADNSDTARKEVSQQYYRIGKVVFGNKVGEKILIEQLKKVNEERKFLRRQLWRMRERMIPNWQERAEEKIRQQEKGYEKQ